MNILGTGSKDTFLKYLQYTFFLIILLYIARALLIPLSIALLISFILFPFCRWLENHKVPRFASISLGLLVFTLIVGLVGFLLVYQFGEFMKEWPQLRIKVDLLLKDIDASFSGSWMKVFLDEEGFIISMVSYISEHIIPRIPITIYNSMISLVLLLLIPVYVALILYYREVLVNFLYHIFPKSVEHYVKTIIPDVIVTYYNFIKGMGIVYLIVGILNSIGLAIIGIPNPIFFGFIASILTFIPYVGITIGAILPMAISWLKFDSVVYPAGIIIVFVIVQILEANVIFPLVVSQKLKINALVTLIVIIGGGLIWGPMGMILFLPFTAILKLIADQSEDLNAVSIILGTQEDLKR